MHYCTECATPLAFRMPEGDQRKRYVCPSCGHIHYQNPRVVAGCIVQDEGRILLCRRDIEPRKGYWTLPAGFVENHESTFEGAVRETREEAEAQVRDVQLYTLINVARISQIHMFYRAGLASGHFAAGHETRDAALFDVQDIPWQEIAFPTVFHTIRHYLRDMAQDRFGFYTFDLGDDAWSEMMELMKQPAPAGRAGS